MFDIHQLDYEHISEMANIIGDSFCNDEPTSKHLGLNAVDFSQWVAKVIMSCLDDQMSFYAKNGTVYGCIISEPLNVHIKIPEYQAATPIFDMLETLYVKLPKDVIESKTLHLFLAATTKEASGKGVCYQLCEHTIKKAKENGYKYIIAELTSPGTQRVLLDKLGFENINEVVYDTSKDFKGCPGKCVLALLTL
jgi:hypothetical protein